MQVQLNFWYRADAIFQSARHIFCINGILLEAIIQIYYSMDYCHTMPPWDL